MFGNPLGNNLCLGILGETMYVLESLGNCVCLGILEEPIFGKQCMFGNPLGNNVCLGIPGGTMYVWDSRNEKMVFSGWAEEPRDSDH